MKSKRVVLYSLIVLVSLLLAISVLLQTQCLRSAFSSYTVLEEEMQQEESYDLKRTKYILLYTTFFGVNSWYLPEETVGRRYFESIKCPETDCVVTTNRSFLKQMTEFDAVLFHVSEPRIHFLPSKAPKRRSPSQIYVAANLESPAHTRRTILEQSKRFFNWTMTYRRDSDVLWNYRNVVDKRSGAVVSPAENPQWRSEGWEQYSNETLLRIVSNKTKMAAQFVSHCGAISKRDDLVAAVQKLMPVDVYGGCGTLKCPRDSPRCAQLLSDEYRFYFAFENSLCRDYITEKVYSAMASDIVPVVFGGADYDQFLPPNSYVDVQRFANVQELVDHLRHLADNPREYVRYFWWKEHYTITRSRPFCELCQKLHEIGAKERVQYYRDIKEWWFHEACQLEAKIKFKEL